MAARTGFLKLPLELHSQILTSADSFNTVRSLALTCCKFENAGFENESMITLAVLQRTIPEHDAAVKLAGLQEQFHDEDQTTTKGRRIRLMKNASLVDKMEKMYVKDGLAIKLNPQDEEFLLEEASDFHNRFYIFWQRIYTPSSESSFSASITNQWFLTRLISFSVAADNDLWTEIRDIVKSDLNPIVKRSKLKRCLRSTANEALGGDIRLLLQFNELWTEFLGVKHLGENWGRLVPTLNLRGYGHFSRVAEMEFVMETIKYQQKSNWSFRAPSTGTHEMHRDFRGNLSPISEFVDSKQTREGEKIYTTTRDTSMQQMQTLWPHFILTVFKTC